MVRVITPVQRAQSGLRLARRRLSRMLAGTRCVWFIPCVSAAQRGASRQQGWAGGRSAVVLCSPAHAFLRAYLGDILADLASYRARIRVYVATHMQCRYMACSACARGYVARRRAHHAQRSAPAHHPRPPSPGTACHPCASLCSVAARVPCRYTLPLYPLCCRVLFIPAPLRSCQCLRSHRAICQGRGAQAADLLCRASTSSHSSPCTRLGCLAHSP